MRAFSTRRLLPVAFAAGAACLNFALGSLTHWARIPLYFDSIFTMVVASRLGLAPGLVTALATNALLAASREVLFPFVLCSACTALIAWLARRRGRLRSVPDYVGMGLAAALANAVVGSVISAFAFGSFSGVHRIDELVAGFVIAGQSMLSSTFLAGAITNLIDKLLSAIAAFALERWLDARSAERRPEAGPRLGDSA